jgi:hypothetical protein
VRLVGNRDKGATPSRAVLPGVGTKIRRRRAALGLSTRQLASMCSKHGVSIDGSKIVHIEAEDSRGGTTLPTVRALCLALNVSADWLLGISTDPHPR